MIDATDAVNPDWPPVKAQAARHVLVLEQVNVFLKAVKEHSEAVGSETERSLVAVSALSQLCADIRLEIEGHMQALEGRSEEQAEIRGMLLDLTAAVRALGERLPDPTRVRHEILGDLWQSLEPLVLELGKELCSDLDARVSESASRLYEAAAHGFMAPVRPEEGAPLLARMQYRRERCIYRIKQVATGWLPVIMAVGVAALVLLAGSQFVLITHRPL
jgi:hypothetical protein